MYEIIFGILILIAEARWTGLLKHFKFLQHFIGLGMFYIFVGGLALNQAWYQYVEAILCLVVGVIYLCLGAICCKTMGDIGGTQTTIKGYGDPTRAGEVGADGKKQPDAIKDLKKKAAHMAVDHAIENEGGPNPFA